MSHSKNRHYADAKKQGGGIAKRLSRIGEHATGALRKALGDHWEQLVRMTLDVKNQLVQFVYLGTPKKRLRRITRAALKALFADFHGGVFDPKSDVVRLPSAA